jgi:hypothetical protein
MDTHKTRKLTSAALRAKGKKELAPLRKLSVVIGRGGADRASGDGRVGKGEARESREDRGKVGGTARLAGGSGGCGGFKK